MVKKLGMIENFVPLPEDNKGHIGPINIFLSSIFSYLVKILDDFNENKAGCLVLIQGSGAVRAGIWSRYCCVNENLDIGSVFPFLEWSKSHNFASIVLNPNFNRDPKTNLMIPKNGTMDAHCEYVWNKFISKCPATKIFIVTHSAGGYCVYSLLKSHCIFLF